MTVPLTPEQIADLAAQLPDWRVEGDSLVRDLEAPSFPAAIEWVVLIAEAAERLDHHPDIDIRWRRLRLALTTHSADRRVTDLDVQVARAIDAIVG